MPKGKDYVWILVGVALAIFVLPLVSAKIGKKRTA